MTKLVTLISVALSLLSLVSAAGVTLEGTLELAEQIRKVLDPARSSILISNIDTEAASYAETAKYHFNCVGQFAIPGLETGNYTLEFVSKDFDLQRSNLLHVVVDAEEKIRVYETLHGNAVNLKTLTELDYPLVIPGFSVRFKDYADVKANGLLAMIPFIGFIKNNPIMSLIGAGMLLLGLMPHIIGYLDPEYAARLAAANKQEAEAKTESGSAEKLQEQKPSSTSSFSSSATKGSSTAAITPRAGTSGSSKGSQAARRRK